MKVGFAEMGIRDLPELPDAALPEADDNDLFAMLFRAPGGFEKVVDAAAGLFS